jgi:hypothetical protein
MPSGGQLESGHTNQGKRMLFKFFKRTPPPAPAKPKAKRRPVTSSQLPDPGEPSALPEVQEGSDHEDWALWENSVAALDSQMPTRPMVSRFRQELEQPSEFQDVEAYAAVKRKDP